MLRWILFQQLAFSFISIFHLINAAPVPVMSIDRSKTLSACVENSWHWFRPSLAQLKAPLWHFIVKLVKRERPYRTATGTWFTPPLTQLKGYCDIFGLWSVKSLYLSLQTVRRRCWCSRKEWGWYLLEIKWSKRQFNANYYSYCTTYSKNYNLTWGIGRKG